MCGIAGIVTPDTNKLSQHRLKVMTDAIKHRGPQGEKFWINNQGNVGFGHRRLCIIDLTEGGAQPMHYLSRYTIIFNGEIYNYVELKEELIKKGYTFTTHSDTEVLLAVYACYGKECLQHLDGMFAFAIWDEQAQTLFCARDRFGEKPFYYYNDGVQFLFASEMKALWAADIGKNLNNKMLLNYLSFGWVQNPVNKSETFYENIFSLPPSHCLLYQFQQNNKPSIKIESYWDIDKQEQLQNYSIDDVRQKFIELFTTSLKRRLRSDVPIGSSISGGLDSSSVVAIVKNLIGKTEKQKTFSAVFPGFGNDESKHIAQVVQQFKIENYQVTPTADDFIKDFEKLAEQQEEPFQSASVYAQYKVYELAKQHNVTVILDGQGADEMLAGYPKYYHWYWQELIAKGKWKQAREEIKAAKENGQKIDWGLKNYAAAYISQLAANLLQKRGYQQQLHHADLAKDFIANNNDKASIYKPAVFNLNDILYFNTMQFGLEELLRYADRNSMAHSREVRLPFLSHELVQFIFSLPSSFKISNGFTKQILRLSMQEILPSSIVWRKDKVGFEPPQKQWFQNPRSQELVHESRKKLVSRGILKSSVLQKPLQQQSAHEADNFDWRYLCAAQCF